MKVLAFLVIADILLADLSKRIRRAYNQMENNFSSNVQQRVVRILLEMARQEGEYDKGILIFNLRISRI